MTRCLCRSGSCVIIVTLACFARSPLHGDDVVDGVSLPDVSAAQISARVERVLEAYRRTTLEASFDETRSNGRRNGKFTYASDGRKWSTTYQGSSSQGDEQSRSVRWVAGFDGRTHYDWDQSRGTLSLAETGNRENLASAQLVFSSHGREFPRMLKTRQWVIKQKPVHGYPCYHLVSHRENARYELAVAPHHGYLPIQYRVYQNDKLAWSHELRDLKAAGQEIWYPGQIEYRSPSGVVRKYQVSKFETVADYQEDFFDLRLSGGVGVEDFRTGECYRNDPWWPEVRTLLRDGYNWPPPKYPRLRELSSYVDESMEGQVAPQLQVKQWIAGPPTTLALRREKVTLLYFSTGSLISPNPQWVTALKALAVTYKEFDFQVIGMLTHSTAPEDARQNVSELQIPWPVGISAEGATYMGKSFEDYKLKTYISPILIDHKGKIHLVRREKIAEQARELLIAAGHREVPAISLDFVQSSSKMLLDVQRRYRQWIDEAPKTSRIRGKVVSASGPVPLVRVEAIVQLELSSAYSTAGTTILPYRQARYQSQTAGDGTFELPGLCKGIYAISLKPAEGPAVTRHVIVPGPNQLIEVKLNLIDE